MTIDKEAISLVKIPDAKHLPTENSENDDSPIILTLRNTVSALLGKKKASGKEDVGLSKSKSLLSKISLKGALLTLGGIAAMLAGKKAMASTAEEPAATDFPKIDVDRSLDAINDPHLDEINKSIEDEVSHPRIERGPVSAKTTAPRIEDTTDSTLSRKSSAPTESVDRAIARAAQATGEDITWLRAIIHMESGGDPRARSTQYLGLGQIGKSAWAEVKSTGLNLPAITGGPNDPRYDPYLNALVTAKIMDINRKRISSAAKAAGYKEPTLGLLYAAHNLGATTINKMLAEKDSSKWDEQTKKFVANQATELTQGGLGNYLKNADAAMKSHYTTANVDVNKQKVATAESIGVMSSQKPQQLASTQRTEAPPVQLAAERIEAPSSTSSKVKPPPVLVSNKDEGQQHASAPRSKQGGDSGQTARTEEPFRLPNGQMASV